MSHLKTTQITYEVFENATDLPKDEYKLLEKAREAMKHSYSPYSRFQVGCAVLLKSGEVITGSNQENASYPLGLCAERVALFATGSMGKGNQVTKLATLCTGHKKQTVFPSLSCGGCRQVIGEYEELSGNPLVMLFSGAKGIVYRFVGIENLLPLSFTHKDLKS